MTLISIHQPVYLPWLGFFKKIMTSEIFVFLDDVQYEKNGWHNRNKIKTKEGPIWLTVPVNSKNNVNLNEITIEHLSNWQKKHSKSISLNYSKSKFFDAFWPDLEIIYQKDYERLLDLNLDIIHLILKKMNIKTKIIFSSELKITKSGSDRILEICKILNADRYLSGIQGKNYLKIDDFNRNKIDVSFQNFQHPTYSQLYEPFIPNLSAIDLLFNEGQNAYHTLEKSENF